MKMINPKNQTNEQIVQALLKNNKHQYTESAHAEIFTRLINTITSFNQKAGKTEKLMIGLAVAQVMLAIAQVFLALIQLKSL